VVGRCKAETGCVTSRGGSHVCVCVMPVCAVEGLDEGHGAVCNLKHAGDSMWECSEALCVARGL
jgi:hypothetical protein